MVISLVMNTNKKRLMDRRKFLSMVAGGAALSMMPLAAFSDNIKTKAKIVILGAGAGGLAVANRLAARLDGAKITMVDGRKEHWYQPGFTLIAAGFKPASYSVTKTTKWVADGVDLLQEYATEIDAEAKFLMTANGTKLPYDYLVVAPGLTLEWDKIEGFDLNMVGKEGIAAVYAGPEQAEKSFKALTKFTNEGGQGLFTRPATGMKCAGAPLKYTFLTDDIARQKNNRSKMEITYAAHSNSLFGVPVIHEKVVEMFNERDIRIENNHIMKAIDHGKKLATFKTPIGDVELPYDFTNVIPPQRAPDIIMNSPLPWADKWKGQGWVEVDKHSLRHNRYPEIFACGDVAGVPLGKTAASVKWMAPVIEDHIVAQIAGKEGTKSFNGYTSCPLITTQGKAMLVEFDYDKKLIPSFPGVVDPMDELWTAWMMKKVTFKAVYYAMLRGKA